MHWDLLEVWRLETHCFRHERVLYKHCSQPSGDYRQFTSPEQSIKSNDCGKSKITGGRSVAYNSIKSFNPTAVQK